MEAQDILAGVVGAVGVIFGSSVIMLHGSKFVVNRKAQQEVDDDRDFISQSSSTSVQLDRIHDDALSEWDNDFEASLDLDKIYLSGLSSSRDPRVSQSEGHRLRTRYRRK